MSRGFFLHPEAESDVARDITMGEKSVILEHHADTALMSRNSSQIGAVPCDGPLGRRDDAGDRRQNAAFAPSGRAE